VIKRRGKTQKQTGTGIKTRVIDSQGKSPTQGKQLAA